MRSSPSTTDTRREAVLRTCAVIGVVITCTAILGLGALQYAMPEKLRCCWGFNWRGAEHFRQVMFGGHLPTLSPVVFVAWFRIFLIASWLGYAVAVVAAIRGGILKPKAILGVVVPLAVLLAVFCPASLSCDAYGYIAYARMQVVYGLNPYADTPRILLAHADPTVKFLVWDIPTPYGPVWTVFSIMVVWLLRSVGLWWQLVAMKLVAAGGLIATALAGRIIADRLSPGKGNLTLLAIGLNPLFLIEGPGSGHNDLAMMALALIGAALVLNKRYILGDLLIGCSVGVKYVTAPILPWLIVERLRGKRPREIALLALLAIVIVLGPTILCFAPFWQGADTFAGLGSRWSQPQTPADRDHSSATLGVGPTEPGTVKRFSGFSSAIARQWPLMIVFLILSLWVYLRGSEGSWLTAWALLSWCVIVWATGVRFPWYLVWPWAAALTRWDRPHIGISSVCFCAAVFLMMMYTIPVGM